jgi:hypothetical protein
MPINWGSACPAVPLPPSIMEQLEIVTAGVTVHVIGSAREPLRILKRATCNHRLPRLMLQPTAPTHTLALS